MYLCKDRIIRCCSPIQTPIPRRTHGELRRKVASQSARKAKEIKAISLLMFWARNSRINSNSFKTANRTFRGLQRLRKRTREASIFTARPPIPESVPLKKILSYWTKTTRTAYQWAIKPNLLATITFIRRNTIKGRVDWINWSEIPRFIQWTRLSTFTTWTNNSSRITSWEIVCPVLREARLSSKTRGQLRNRMFSKMDNGSRWEFPTQSYIIAPK